MTPKSVLLSCCLRLVVLLSCCLVVLLPRCHVVTLSRCLVVLLSSYLLVLINLCTNSDCTMGEGSSRARAESMVSYGSSGTVLWYIYSTFVHLK